MKIVTWNCNGGFRNKFGTLSRLNADILIIQECENPAFTSSKQYIEWSQNYLWSGDNKHKGLGVFAKPEINLIKLDWSDTYKDHTVKHFLPCSINNEFDLLAVWTHSNNSPNFGYMGQFWKYLQLHKEKFTNTIIIGDFNSNAIWDQWDRWWNHSDVVNELYKINIHSLYHTFTQEMQGKETRPTFYMNRNLQKPYHIDYCFASSVFVERLNNLTIEDFESWKKQSDHSPMILTFDSQ